MFHAVLPEPGDRVIITNKKLKNYGNVGTITRIRTRSKVVIGEIDRYLHITLMASGGICVKDIPGAVEIIKDSVKT